MKNIDELRDAVTSLLQTGINFTVHFGVEGADGITYLQADLDDDSTQGLSRAFTTPLEHWFANEDLTVTALSGVDQRDDVLYYYDLPTRPVGFDALASTGADSRPIFSFFDHSLTSIKSIAIKISSIEHTLTFFKHVYPVALVKRSNILMMKIGDRLSFLDNDVLKITAGFDVLLYEDGFYINGFKKFEKAFKFDVIERQIRTEATAAIMALGICDDNKEHLANGVAPGRDYIRVANSDVLSLPAETIITHAISLQQKTKLKIQNGKIQLDSKQAVRIFMKMLNDDYLRSALTNYDYDTLAKNKLI